MVQRATTGSARRSWVAAGWILLVLLAVTSPAHAQRGSSVSCRKCDDAGRLVCDEHPGEEGALEESVLFCSHLEDCAACGGAGFVDCPRCERPEVERQLEERRGEVARAPERWKTLDDAMGRPLVKIETAHFLLVFEVESMKVGRKRLGAHGLHHLYAQRLEEIYALYLETLGAEDGDFAKKMRVFVWAYGFDQEEGSLRFCRQSGVAGVRLHGVDPAYSVCGARSAFPKDDALHRNLAHNVAQILFSHQRPSEWIGNKKGGWAEEGLAHWFEDRLFQRCDNFCYEEQASAGGVRAGNFRPMARKLVAREQNPPMAEVLLQNSDTLTPDMHIVAMSYVDYLISLDGAKFGTLGRRLREGVPSRDALLEVFGLGPLELERDWKAWVLETYPTR